MRPHGLGPSLGSKAVIYSGKLSKIATKNAFYFYGDLVPKGKTVIQKENFFPIIWTFISDQGRKVHSLQNKTQPENRLVSLNWGIEYIGT